MIEIVALFAPIVMIAIYFIFEEEIWIRIEDRRFENEMARLMKRTLRRLNTGKYDGDMSNLRSDLDSELARIASKF